MPPDGAGVTASSSSDLAVTACTALTNGCDKGDNAACDAQAGLCVDGALQVPRATPPQLPNAVPERVTLPNESRGLIDDVRPCEALYTHCWGGDTRACADMDLVCPNGKLTVPSGCNSLDFSCARGDSGACALAQDLCSRAQTR